MCRLREGLDRQIETLAKRYELAVMTGDFLNFQFWYRDPGGGLQDFNLSNAVQVVFAP